MHKRISTIEALEMLNYMRITGCLPEDSFLYIEYKKLISQRIQPLGLLYQPRVTNEALLTLLGGTQIVPVKQWEVKANKKSESSDKQPKQGKSY